MKELRNKYLITSYSEDKYGNLNPITINIFDIKEKEKKKVLEKICNQAFIDFEIDRVEIIKLYKYKKIIRRIKK